VGISSWTLWSLGYPEQALKRSDEALAIARQSPLPFSQVLGLHFAALLQLLRSDRPLTFQYADAALTQARESGFLQFQAQEAFMRGWALLERDRDEGLKQMQEGIALFHTTGARLIWPHYAMLMAEAYSQDGCYEEGLALLSDAFVAITKSNEQRFAAELYRLKGELTLQKFHVPGSKLLIPKAKWEHAFSKPSQSRRSNKPSPSNSAR
jgi:predicted ATPase